MDDDSQRLTALIAINALVLISVGVSWFSRSRSPKTSRAFLLCALALLVGVLIYFLTRS